MNTKDDHSLIPLIIQGDEKAFEFIFKKYYSGLCVFAAQYINDRDAAEEVVQAVFVRIWEKRSSLSIENSFKNYLFRSVRNHCLNQLQHEKIKIRHAQSVLKETDPDPIWDDYFIEPDFATKIEDVIAMLPPKRLEIFRLSREKGLKYKEIAEQMNISVKTVEVQMGFALKFLREKLKDFRQDFHFLFLFFKQKNICR